MTKSALLLTALLGLSVLPLSSHAKSITFVKPSDGIAAHVDDEIILHSELNELIAILGDTYARQGKQLTKTQLFNEALDLLIVRKIQLGIIKRAGVTPNETIINQQLLEIARSEGFDNLTAFAQSLESKQKGSYAKLRNELIEEAAIAALWQHELSRRAKVSSQEIEAFLSSAEGRTLNQDEYRTTHVRVPYLDDPSRLTPAQKDAAMQTALRLRQALQAGTPLVAAMNQARGNYPVELQGADTGYNAVTSLPPDLANTITSLNVGEVSTPIVTASGVDVILLSDKRTGGQVLLSEWNTSHILAKVDASQGPTIAEQRINELYNALQRGANFEDLAATYSDDVGSATQRGNLGWVSEDQMVAEFEAVMKQTTKGDFSTPFATQFGYHILKVNDVRQRDVTNSYRRARAEEILISRLAPQIQEDWIHELKANAYVKVLATPQ